MLIEQLRGDDRVALVVYAGSFGPRASVDVGAREAAVIREAIDRLGAGGSTNGAPGHRARVPGREGRTSCPAASTASILCTDGDFNVGVTSESGLVELIESEGEDRRLPHGSRLRHGQPEGQHARRSSRTRGTATTATSTPKPRRRSSSSTRSTRPSSRSRRTRASRSSSTRRKVGAWRLDRLREARDGEP